MPHIRRRNHHIINKTVDRSIHPHPKPGSDIPPLLLYIIPFPKQPSQLPLRTTTRHSSRQQLQRIILPGKSSITSPNKLTPIATRLIKTRVRIKKQQVHRVENDCPAYVAIIEFGTPCAHISQA
jgi:hypothetical protein